MTPEISMSAHGVVRASQRGLRQEDIALICSFGEDVCNDGILLTNRAVREETDELTRQINGLLRAAQSQRGAEHAMTLQLIAALRETRERLVRRRGFKAVVCGETLVTCYKPGPANLRRTMGRNSRSKARRRRARR